MRKNYFLEQFFRDEAKISGNGWRLPVVRLNDELLNPFAQDGVALHAVLGGELPYQTMKSLAVLGLLIEAKSKGRIKPGETTLVEATSGATGRCLAQFALSDHFGVRAVVLVMKNDAPFAKRNGPYFAGARIEPPQEGLSPIGTARRMCARDGWLNLDQYANPANALLYRTWAAPKIIAGGLAPDLLVAPVGTGGTAIGLGRGLRAAFPGLKIIGAMCASGEEIPGMRDEAGMTGIKLPWQNALDERVCVKAEAARLGAVWLQWADGIDAGLSGGATLAAALSFLRKNKQEGKLDELRNRKGGIDVLIVVHDNAAYYLPDRFPMLHGDRQNPASAPKLWEFLEEG